MERRRWPEWIAKKDDTHTTITTGILNFIWNISFERYLCLLVSQRASTSHLSPKTESVLINSELPDTEAMRQNDWQAIYSSVSDTELNQPQVKKNIRSMSPRDSVSDSIELPTTFRRKSRSNLDLLPFELVRGISLDRNLILIACTPLWYMDTL